MFVCYKASRDSQVSTAMRDLRILAATTLLVAVVSCSSPGGGTQSLSVSPLSGPPGTPLAVSGIDIQPQEAAEVEAWLGDARAPLLITEDGEVLSAVPLYLGAGAGASSWPQPPAGPQVLELRKNGQVLGRSGNGVTVEELVPAPGSAQVMEEALTTVADGYGALFDLLPLADSLGESDMRQAAMAMLNGVISDGENSLAAVLDGTAPILGATVPDTELLDALLASSGAVGFYQEYAASLSTPEAALAPLALGDLCHDEGDDVVMACLMQIQVVMADYAEIVVKPTAYAYAHTVGLAAGAAPLVGLAGPAVATASIINSLLGVTDFIMTKVLPALLPSELDTFEIELASSRLDVGDLTDSTVTASASNTPVAISAADLAELVGSAIGLKGVKGLDELDKYLLDVANFALDIAYKQMRAVGDAHPGTFPDLEADHLHIPHWTWGPYQVTNERLITLFSFEPEVAAPLPEGEELEWRALAEGEATLRAQPRGPGTKAKLLRDHKLCLGCVYSGGAFGLDSTTSTADVVVGPVTFQATPTGGKAPFTTSFSWGQITPSQTPVTCTLDPGDGSASYNIADCATTAGQDHTYAHTSRLATAGGAYTAVLSIDGSEAPDETVSTEVTVGWTLTATPASGESPLTVGFSWSGLDPNGPVLTCSLEPGDGSPAIEVGDCANVTSAQHTYASDGNYSATLFVEGGAFTDNESVNVVVAPGDPSDYYTGWFTGLFEPSTGRVWWEGTATFKRDPADPRRFYTTTVTPVRLQGETVHVDCTRTFDHVIQVPPHAGVEPIALLSIDNGRLTIGQISHWIVDDVPMTWACPDGTSENYTSFQHFYLYIPYDSGRVADADGVFSGSATWENVDYTWSIAPGLVPPPGRRVAAPLAPQ